MTGEQLCGRWRLVSYVARAHDGSLTYPFGADARGSLVYTEGGWMAAQLCAGDRGALGTADLLGGSEAERAEAFSGYVAYCGSYEVRGDVVVHHVAMSLFPNWVGSEQARSFVVAGDELVLRTPPIEAGGASLSYEFRWRREEPRPFPAGS
ncbi:MAG TPA: lipocalin-like domain-containing protein [Gaiellaceae bacterium]|nr:lipocalin-like domain-containing protein [Gaiellaceae bacterium]